MSGDGPIRMRASDADREEAVLALREHYSDGRLDAQEFTTRMERAQEATYLVDLDPLFADLPGRSGAGRAVGVAARPTGPAWAGRPYGPPRPSGPGPGARPAAFVLLAVAVVASVVMIAHGHVPFFLPMVAFVVFVGSRRHRRLHEPAAARAGRLDGRRW